MPKKADPKGKETKPAGPKPQEEKPKVQKSPKGDPGKVRRAARQMGEEQAQRAAKPEEKKAQKAAKPDEQKKAQKAAKPDEQKAQKAAKPDEQKKVQKAAKTDDIPVQRATSGTSVHVSDGNDAYEREARQIGADVAAGQEISPRRIGASAKGAARAAKTDEGVRKAGKPEEKKTAQKLEAPTTPAATLPPTAAQTPDEVASNAIRTKGSGVPLAPGTRAVLEERMGVSLGRVRVHESSAARTAAEGINARAFTHGNDIWLGPGESQSDIELMAHEVTHVLQQARGAPDTLVQRKTAAPEEAPSGGEWDFEKEGVGKIKKDSELWIPKLKVPTFKKPPITPSPLVLGKKVKRSDEQRAIWEKAAEEEGKIEKKIDTKTKDEEAPAMKKGGEPIYFLELKGENFFVIGSKAEIRKRVLRPFWDKGGKKHPYQVDHKHEVQLHSPEHEPPDRLSNLWLLDAEANMASGRNIKNEKDEKIQSLLNAATRKKEKKGGKAKEAEPDPEGKDAPIFDKAQDADKIRNKYKITFAEVVGGLEPTGKPDKWELDEIREQAKQLDNLQVLNKKQVADRNLQGSPSKLVIYTNEAGGGRRNVPWPEGVEEAPVTLKYGARILEVEKVRYNHTKKSGKLIGTAFKGNKLINSAPFELDITEMDAVDYGGYITSQSVREEFKDLDLEGLSPIEWAFLEITDKGLEGRGQVLPTVPLIKDIGIDIVIDGDDIYLSKTFTADEFKFPGPIQVTAASLEIYAGTIGLGARGTVFFEIQRVGEGKLTGIADMKEGFGVEGEFNFDSELFDPARVKVGYKKSKFYGEGELGIPEGKVKGIKSANFKASFEDEKIDATGKVIPNIPGVEQGNLEFHYAPETGMVIAGRLDLRKDIPGVEGGYVQAELSRPPDAPEWGVKAKGEAKPKIPGLNTTIVVTYDNGIFDANGMTSFEKGMVKGAVQIGITNRVISPEGTPAGAPDEKSNKVTIYGGGAVTMRIAPWLEGTAGIRILPNGEIEVVGKIALPSTLDIFPEKRFDKNLFKIGIDIPIVGVAVAGQRIGIFANITGGLDLTAGIGPGQLQDVFLSVTYNPAHEDQTHVQGGAKLHIPADAGLRLFVRGGLGVGIPIVSAQAGLEIGGALGLEGALDAAVEVDWMPSKGLKIDALGSVYVQPKFTFDITGFVLVEADLWITTIELYSKRWKFASFSYGSDLRFGLKFPIHYEEGKPFDVSLSDVQFELPNVDPMETLKGLIGKIA